MDLLTISYTVPSSDASPCGWEPCRSSSVLTTSTPPLTVSFGNAIVVASLPPEPLFHGFSVVRITLWSPPSVRVNTLPGCCAEAARTSP